MEAYYAYLKIAHFLCGKRTWIYTEICFTPEQEDKMRKTIVCGLIGSFNITS